MPHWSHARGYVDGMWRIVQQPTPNDYVLATGETHSVRESVEAAFRHVRVEIAWQRAGLEETAVDTANGRVLIEIDPRYFRPTETDDLQGDAGKARDRLGWRHNTGFEELVREMAEADRGPIARENNLGPGARR